MPTQRNINIEIAADTRPLYDAMLAAGQAINDAYIDGWQQPTRWQRFCYRFRDFWLMPRW